MITNLRYADDIILLATSEAELQELVDRLDRVSRKYSVLINVDKTKVMAIDGIAENHILRRYPVIQPGSRDYIILKPKSRDWKTSQRSQCLFTNRC